MDHNKSYYFLLKHWRELATASAAVVTALSAFAFSSKPGLTFSAAIIVTIVALILTLYFILKEKDFYYVPLDDYRDKEDWFGGGKFEFDKSKNAYLVGACEAGVIFSKCLLWSDYFLKGDFKILNKYLGVVVRATDLLNYVMLQIGKNGIRPHIRVNGGWISYETAETGLTFEKNIKDGVWYTFELTVKAELIYIKIFNVDAVVIDKSWQIKKGTVAVPVFDKDDDKRKLETHISVSFDYGSVGFRNGDDNERALVKGLLVQSISNKSN